MTTHILLIEHSNLNQTESLVPSLEAQGYQAHLVHSPQTAAKKIETLWPNLIVFNPSSSLLELVAIKEVVDQTNLNIPCIVISDTNSLSTEMNVDIFVVAPGDPQQLTQGIQKAISKQKNRFIRLPNLIFDRQQCQVLRNEERFSLTPKEFKLLQLLLTHHDQVMSRKAIMQKVWETDYMGDTRTLDVHVRWLREKIEQDPSHPRRLITVRGVGYRFIIEEIE